MTIPLPSTMYHPSPLHNVPSLSPPQRTISLPSTTYPQDHMWQHRQEERDLRRTETDIVKQRKQVQRSMKEYEASECNLYMQQTNRTSLSRPLLVELWFACKILQIETDNPPSLPPSNIILQEFRGVFQEGLHCERLFVMSGSMPTPVEGEIQEALPWCIEVRVCQHQCGQ